MKTRKFYENDTYEFYDSGGTYSTLSGGVTLAYPRKEVKNDKRRTAKIPFRFVGHISTDKMHFLTYSSEDGLLGYCDRTPRLKHGQYGKTRRHWRIGGKVYKSDEKFYEALAKWGGGEK